MFHTHTHPIFLRHTPSFTYNFVTHNFVLLLDPPPPPLSFLLSPSPLQHLVRIIGRSCLVGLSGPLISFSPNRFTCMGFLLLSKGCIPAPHDFASASGLVSHSGCLGPHEFTPIFHLSFTLVCHSGCLGPQEFTVYTCLPHSSPTLVFHTCLALWVPWAA